MASDTAQRLKPTGMLGHLSDAQWQTLAPLFDRLVDYKPGDTISERGEALHYSLLTVEGIVARHVAPPGTSRGSFVALQVPGDFVDLHAFPLKRLDHSVVALTHARVAVIQHDSLQKVMDKDIELARVLWFLTLVDASIHRHWAMRNSMLRAMARVANFFSEFDTRMSFALGQEQELYRLEVTQTDLSDACGMTPIHVNRVLRDLREDGCCTFRNGDLIIHDRSRLRRIGQFDTAYLYLPGDETTF